MIRAAMNEESSKPRRLSIEERALRRERINAGDRDRYAALLETLREGRETSARQGARERLEWHPVAWLLVRVSVLLLIAYVVVINLNTMWREASVDTWTGPDDAVQSGQRLAGCSDANAQHDDLLPTWVRYRGTVYVMTDRRRPAGGAGQPGQTGYPESGYSLGIVRILLLEDVPPHIPPPELLLITPGSYAATIYMPDPDCS